MILLSVLTLILSSHTLYNLKLTIRCENQKFKHAIQQELTYHLKQHLDIRINNDNHLFEAVILINEREEDFSASIVLLESSNAADKVSMVLGDTGNKAWLVEELTEMNTVVPVYFRSVAVARYNKRAISEFAKFVMGQINKELIDPWRERKRNLDRRRARNK